MNESSRVVGLLGGVKEVVIEKDKLIVWADADNFLALSAQDTVDAITRALEVNGDPFTLVVNKQAGGVDMDSEISKIKKMIGDAKLNIKNARN